MGFRKTCLPRLVISLPAPVGNSPGIQGQLVRKMAYIYNLQRVIKISSLACSHCSHNSKANIIPAVFPLPCSLSAQQPGEELLNPESDWGSSLLRTRRRMRPGSLLRCKALLSRLPLQLLPPAAHPAAAPAAWILLPQEPQDLLPLPFVWVFAWMSLILRELSWPR